MRRLGWSGSSNGLRSGRPGPNGSMANGSANGLLRRREAGPARAIAPPPAAPRSRRRRARTRSPSRRLRTSPAPIGSLSRLRNVPLVEVSASCHDPPRNATAKCRLDSSRSGSGSTQSTPGPRPTENSPPVTLRVSGATASGQRSTVIVSCMSQSQLQAGRRSIAMRLCGQSVKATRGDITPTFNEAAQSFFPLRNVAANCVRCCVMMRQRSPSPCGRGEGRTRHLQPRQTHQSMTVPPSTAIVCPVTKQLPSEISHATVPVRSAGSSVRWID